MPPAIYSVKTLLSGGTRANRSLTKYVYATSHLLYIHNVVLFLSYKSATMSNTPSSPKYSKENEALAKVAASIPWSTRLTKEEKKRMRARALVRQQRLHPTIDDVRKNVKFYTSKMTPRAAGIVHDILARGYSTTLDTRDLRTVPVEDRVPRSLECPGTPPGYWNAKFF
jgi:hypothetical protein